MRTRMILPAILLLGAMPFATEARESTTVTGGRGQNRHPGASRGADAAPVLSASGDIYPDGTAR